MFSVARGAVCNLARNAATRRGLATSRALRAAEDPVHPGYKSIRQQQEKFLKEDGTPIYIKGGAMDRVLYLFTMAACVGAVGWEALFFYELSQK